MEGLNKKPIRYLLQVINYSVFMALIWYFSTAPSFQVIAEDQAMITIAFAHAGELREACRMLSSEELAELPPNMRKLDDCPRERSPVTIEATLDGAPIYSDVLQPAGLFDDGGVDVYFSKKIPAGSHSLKLEMNDSVRTTGFNHELQQQIEIRPAQILLVAFDPRTGFIFGDTKNR